MSTSARAFALLTAYFGLGPASDTLSVPGRVNLIGEHIDYHDLPVLPAAIQRVVTVAFRPRSDALVRAVSSAQSSPCEFNLLSNLEPSEPGAWANFLKAAARALQTRWPLTFGLEAAVVSDLPVAAGLSSSTALLVGFALALLRVNGITATLEELMALLPEGEQFVGTRGGGMDHAAVLASRRGCALLVGFAPFSLRRIPVPADWRFLVAHSLTRAEKSGAVRAEYNALREDGRRALEALNLPSYRAALESNTPLRVADALPDRERSAFRHVLGEARRVRQAVTTFENADKREFGRLLVESHASLRDQLQVSLPSIDALVMAALDAGAFGARLTGAGFGGCVLVLTDAERLPEVRKRLIANFYSTVPGFHPPEHLFDVQPSDGALYL